MGGDGGSWTPGLALARMAWAGCVDTWILRISGSVTSPRPQNVRRPGTPGWSGSPGSRIPGRSGTEVSGPWDPWVFGILGIPEASRSLSSWDVWEPWCLDLVSLGSLDTPAPESWRAGSLGCPGSACVGPWDLQEPRYGGFWGPLSLGSPILGTPDPQGPKSLGSPIPRPQIPGIPNPRGPQSPDLQSLGSPIPRSPILGVPDPSRTLSRHCPSPAAPAEEEGRAGVPRCRGRGVPLAPVFSFGAGRVRLRGTPRGRGKTTPTPTGRISHEFCFYCFLFQRG